MWQVFTLVRLCNFACKADENVKKEGTVQDMGVITRLAGGNSEDYFCPIETVVCGSCHSCDRCDSTLLKEYICSEKQKYPDECYSSTEQEGRPVEDLVIVMSNREGHTAETEEEGTQFNLIL